MADTGFGRPTRCRLGLRRAAPPGMSGRQPAEAVMLSVIGLGATGLCPST